MTNMEILKMIVLSKKNFFIFFSSIDNMVFITNTGTLK